MLSDDAQSPTKAAPTAIENDLRRQRPSRASPNTLADLPPEILAAIVSHAPTARFLRDVSLTCRVLHDVVELDGWKTFVHSRFPSFHAPLAWREAAHAFTTHSRNWDRKAFIARAIEPHSWIHALPGSHIKESWNKRQSQTMGYQPVIDSYDEFTGSRWNSRKEVVAWGAGAELVMKVTWRGDDVFMEHRRVSKDREYRARHFEGGPTKFAWLTYQDPSHVDGRDDITTVNILKPEHRSRTPGAEAVIVGRASGDLSLLQLSEGNTQCTTRSFDTRSTPVRAAALGSGQAPLLATCLTDGRIQLFPTKATEQSLVPPSSEIVGSPHSDGSGRLRATTFLSPDRLAVARIQCEQPVCVYGVKPDGLSNEPIRAFGTGNVPGYDEPASSCAIAKVTESSAGDNICGNVLLNGCYDGIVRLHDMRSPADCEACFIDTVDVSPVFSLCTIGRERLVAGGIRHDLIKVFDLRMPGGRTYSYLDAAPEQRATDPPTPRRRSLVATDDGSTQVLGGWNIFAGGGRPTPSGRRQNNSAVYSLSTPSHGSPSLYAGLENTVLHFNFSAMLDQHPDPLFRHCVVRSATRAAAAGGTARPLHVKRTWQPDRVGARVVDLAMYDHVKAKGVPVRVQRGIGPLDGGAAAIPGYDERWMETRP